MTRSTVLLVTASYDEAAEQVGNHINQAGVRTFRLNTDLFPTEVKATFDPHSGLQLESDAGTVHSSDIMSVWYRTQRERHAARSSRPI